MEESILHVELMDRPVPRVCQGEDSANGGWFDDRDEGLVVINTEALCKSAKDPTSLVSFQGTISMKLVFENPFSSDHIGLGRARDKIPSVVVQEGSEFFFHGLTPVRISKSITAGTRKWGQSLGV